MGADVGQNRQTRGNAVKLTYMNEPEEQDSGKGKVSGAFQKIIGEIEEVGGMLTGDPNTVAEGEFNQEVGDIREDLQEDVATGDSAEK
jgi:uncharacterized protein YjbJ (UPF0337 family)